MLWSVLLQRLLRQGRRWTGALLLIVLLAGCTLFNQSAPVPDGQELPAITDAPTTSRHVGKFVWADLVTSDADRAREFYGALFDWSFSRLGCYTLITNNGKRIAGILEVQPKSGNGKDAVWLTTMSVPDVDRAVERVRQQGGSIIKGPVTMRERGRGALIADPQGAQLVLLHAAGGGDPPDVEPASGDWIWNEIWTNVPDKTRRFYVSLGGYTPIVAGDAYEILERDNRWRAGIRYIFQDQYQARWVPAVRVADPAALLSVVTAQGGKVLVRPDEPPSNGDTALIADPDGALLMLQRWTFAKTGEGQ